MPRFILGHRAGGEWHIDWGGALSRGSAGVKPQSGARGYSSPGRRAVIPSAPDRPPGSTLFTVRSVSITSRSAQRRERVSV